MSMQVKPGYVNPLTLMKGSQLNPKAGQALSQKSASGEVRELQARQQQLQNAMLLMKASSSDSSGMSPKTQEQMEQRLKEVTAELQKAKKEEAVSGEEKRNQDIYERSGGMLPQMEEQFDE